MSRIINFFKAVAGICETQPLPPELWTVEGNTIAIEVDKVPQLGMNSGAVYLQGKGLAQPILVVRTEEGEYYSFANRCTHAGRKLDPVPGEKVLRCCSVSHSTFDYDGRHVSGPAKGPIESYETERSGDRLLIKM